MKTKRWVINAVSFQLLWLVCVQGNNLLALVSLATFMLIHQQYVLERNSEWVLIGCYAIAGFFLETIMSAFDLIHFANSPILDSWGVSLRLAPPWLICLWVGFASTFHHSSQMLRNHMLIAVFLIVVFVPLSYFTGALISHSDFPQGTFVGLLGEAIVWAVVFPLGLKLAKRTIDPVENSEDGNTHE